MKNPHEQTLILCDAHVHIHECFNPLLLIDAAVENFSRVTHYYYGDRPFVGVLLLTEGEREHGFERFLELRNAGRQPEGAQHDDWSIESTEEDASLILKEPRNQRIILISGRQVLTRENMEVLAIGTRQTFEQSKSIDDLIARVHDAGALPVIPWGFGKWMGKRGKHVQRLIEQPNRPFFFLGDNANRPALWPYPALFNMAIQEGIRNLPGSDPLPFHSENKRAGCFGFMLQSSLDESTPFQSLKTKLTDPRTVIEPFGRGESPYRFIRNQVAMQYVKRAKKHRGINP